MNIFKRLFSSNNKQKKEELKTAKVTATKDEVNQILTTEYFDQRYSEEKIDNSILEGSLKMIESYFIDNKIEKKNKQIINHPINLDQIIDDGMGFQMYCKAFNMEDGMVIGSLSMAFSEFMIKNLDFKLYKDNQPEFPLRSMTLKYDKNGAVLSLYPLEYSLKVLNYEANFNDIFNKVKNHLESLPSVDDLLKNIKNE